MRSLALCTIILITCLCCKSNTATDGHLRLSSTHTVIFLDSIDASEAIVLDTKTPFFENIRVVDMAIQMKTNFPKGAKRDSILSTYKLYLQRDVEDFTKVEEAMLSRIMQKAFNLCQSINPTIFPPKIVLIKTKANHFGRSAYYTRNDMIIIPFNEMEEATEQEILGVMLHEVSHIFTRYHPKAAAELYQHIGFRALDKPLVIPDSISKYVLHNPDGVDFEYGIHLTDQDSSFLAIPMIRSNESDFRLHKRVFFQYLQFDLFALRDDGDLYTLLCTREGKTTINWENNASFHRQITMNTDYIIHPDEIIADNFMMLMLAQNDSRYVADLNKEGKVLLEKIKSTLRNIK